MRRSTMRVGGSGLLAMVVTYGIGRHAYGLFVPTFQADFGLSLDALGYYASAAQGGYLVATIATGAITARYGPRPPVIASCLLFAVGAGVVALSPGPVVLAIGVTVAGASAGGTWAPFSDAVPDQVPRPGHERALALVNAGAPVGLVVASGLLLMTGDHWRIAWGIFALLGVVAAIVNTRVLSPGADTPATPDDRVHVGWLLNRGSARLLVAAATVSLTSGVYLTFAPEVVQDAGLPGWSAPAMWALLGVAGGLAGIFGGDLATHHGLRWPSAAAFAGIAGSVVVLLVAPASMIAALGSAALFGVSFTIAFALIVIWSQRVFQARPSAGFTTTIVVTAGGFIVGPSLFGVLATQTSRPTALVVATLPALLATAIPPRRAISDAGPG